MLPNTPFMPMEQWTPEYAAQILSIAQQAQSRAPDVPGMGQPGIVPMGAPGSLNPPPVAPKPEAVDVPAAAPEPASPAMPRGGGGWQAMLPILAAQFYGMSPRTQHMVPMVAQMAQQQRLQMGQQQLSEIRGNIAKLGEKGPDAIKKYLTEAAAAPNLHPEVSKVVADQLAQVTERTNERDAVAKLTSRDPKDIMKEMPKLVESMGTEKAMSLYKGLKLDEKGQFIQAGDQIFWGDRATQQVKEVARATPKFNAAAVGGTDVTQELTRMGVKAEEATPEQLQQASQSLLSRQQAEKEKSRASSANAIISAGAMNAKAQQQGMNALAQSMNRPMEQSEIKEINQLRGAVGMLQDIEDTYDPKFTGQISGRMGAVREFQGTPYKNETEFRQNTIQQLNEYINRITGAAVGQVEEVGRLKAAVPTVTDEPKVFESKLKNSLRIAERILKDSATAHTSTRGARSVEDLTTVPRQGKPSVSPGGRRMGN